MRAIVRDEVGLTVSAGVAARKMVAKIASDAAKPDGLASVAPGTEAAYLAPMPAQRLWGVGPKTKARLDARGVTTIGQIAALSDEAAFGLFGRSGRGMRDLARGLDDRTVTSDRDTRSVSSEETFEYDKRDEADLVAAIAELADDVARRLSSHGLRGSTIGVKVKLADFTVLGRQTQLAQATSDAREIEAAAVHCLARAPIGGAGVRLLGVRVATLTEEPLRQISLFAVPG